MRPRCPVCWNRVHKTVRDHIAGHADNGGRVCPGSYEPWRITIGTSPKKEAA